MLCHEPGSFVCLKRLRCLQNLRNYSSSDAVLHPQKAGIFSSDAVCLFVHIFIIFKFCFILFCRFKH